MPSMDASASSVIVGAAKFVANYGIFLVIAVLLVTACIVRDTTFMAQNGWLLFVIETLLIGTFTTIVLVMVTMATRRVPLPEMSIIAALLLVKVVVVHVLCQLSGIYSTVF